ncbi:hypothetical protein ACFVU3_39190 [Streptomyces sp. NPDC058052]|uniref:hypothetical protein n=1 Tax=Streptomyces sp. NPDC058052 TaxID=3346316 RepID=UPI0036E66D85
MGVSIKLYRRFEQQGIVPARRPRFLDDVAETLSVSAHALERAMNNIPAVRARISTAGTVLTQLVDRYVSQPGRWKGPAVDDADLLDLAALYGRPPQRTRRVLTHELGELRHFLLRMRRERAIADFDTDPQRQHLAHAASERWLEHFSKELALIPERLEQFHRRSVPSDAWQALVDMHDAGARPDGPWVPGTVLGRSATLELLPPSLAQQHQFGDVCAARLTWEGLRHIRLFQDLYGALYPGIRHPLATKQRAPGAAKQPGDMQFSIPQISVRFAFPPLTVAKIMRGSGSKGVDVRLSPTVVVRVGPARPAVTREQDASEEPQEPGS